MAKSKKATPFIDLTKQLLLQIDGVEEKNHTVSWSILREVGDSLDQLIKKLARYSLAGEEVAGDIFQLKFIGFFPGSAVPAYRIDQIQQVLFSTDSLKKDINDTFTFILGGIEKGNFKSIADKYNEPSVKNDIIGSVYNFTNSAGTRPLNIVRIVTGSKVKKLYSVRKMSKDQRLLLQVPIDTRNNVNTNEPVDAIGKLQLNRSAKGRIIKKNWHLYTDKNTALSLRFDSIETDKRIYVLSNEVFFNVVEDKKDSFIVENTLLDIYAYGKNRQEAELDIFSQFDYLYQRVAQLPDEKLSAHLQKAKATVNLIVERIKEK